MKQLITKVSNIFDRTLDLLVILAAVILFYIMLSVAYEIIMRKFLGRGQDWVLEIAEYSLLYITFLIAAWVLRREGHVKMDIVLAQLEPRAQAMVNFITSIIGAIALLLVTWYGATMTWEFFQGGAFLATILEPPTWPIMGIIPIGSFLFFIQFLRRSYSFLVRWRALRDQEQRL